jgi:DNA-directed RNA polymerase subunit RPC12/RpoP
MPICNVGICEKYRAKKPLVGSRYAIGQKMCIDCEIFINYEGIKCPCCGIRLRYKPRSTSAKKSMDLTKSKELEAIKIKKDKQFKGD